MLVNEKEERKKKERRKKKEERRKKKERRKKTTKSELYSDLFLDYRVLSGTFSSVFVNC